MLWEVCLTYLLHCCVAGLWGRRCLPWTRWATCVSVNRVIVIWTITILKCGNILLYYSFPSGTHETRQVPDHHIFQIIIQYLYWPKFLQVIFRYCSQSMCTYQLFSFNHKKDCFFNYYRPIHGLSFRMHFCRLLIQHCVQLCKFWIFQYSSLEKTFHTFTWCCKLL
jgi:hypothetical protein